MTIHSRRVKVANVRKVEGVRYMSVERGDKNTVQAGATLPLFRLYCIHNPREEYPSYLC